MGRKGDKKPKSKYGLKWILAQTKGNRGLWCIFTLSRVLMAVLSIALAFILQAFMDIATGHSDMMFATVIWIAAGLAVTECLLLLLSQYTRSLLYGRTEKRLRTTLLSSIFKKRTAEISKYHTGEMQTRLTADTASVCSVAPNISQNIFANILMFLMASAAAFYLSWRVSLVVFILVPVLLLVMSAFTPIMQKVAKVDKENDEEHRTFMQEALSRLILVKAYFMLEKAAAKSDAIYDKKIKSAVKLGIFEGLAIFSGNLMGMAMFLVVIGYGAFREVVKGIAKEHICIVVTHDPGTMQICDYVYAIGEGGIAERGAPPEIASADVIFA